MIAVLEVKGLTKKFGGLVAINNVSFTTRSGEILGVIGPNGAGKSTLFNLVTGTIPLTSGNIYFSGNDITGKKPEEIAEHGLIRTFQSAMVFKDKTVYENLRIGHQFNRLSRPLHLLSRKRVAAFRKSSEGIVEDLLEFTHLWTSADRAAGELPYGSQKILGVAMALAAAPKQMLMDEPAAGLNPVETEEMGYLVERIRTQRKIDVVLVEHDMGLVTSICDRIIVINKGEIIAVGMPAEIQSNPDVIDAYLGVNIEFN